MNKGPNLIHADQLKNDWPQKGCSNGLWVLARPIPLASIPERFRLAWGVFTGKYDALKWWDQ